MTSEASSAALSELPYPLFVVGTTGPTGPHFMIANWGTQASFTPRRFAVAIKGKARTLANLRNQGAFTINLLDPSRKPLVTELMKKKGEGANAGTGPLPAPRLDGAYAGFDCRLVQVVETGGDHALVIGEVVDGWKRGAGPALTLGDLGFSYSG